MTEREPLAPSDAVRSTRTDVPLSEDDGIHPGFATTALDHERDARTSSDERAADPWIGRVLGNVYRVEAKIGEGGMGAVYRASHIHLGKSVAVKVLTEAIAQRRESIERLKQEAIAASSIDHDNIVDVVSFDRYDDGSVFIVMELLRGESLAARLAGGRMPLDEVASIALQVCDALGAAHARNIVHRDLKPENVFLARKGERERVKVLDFGISKIKSADAEQVRMTRTGQLVGTPLYMSPEQARGETEIDRRVDVYALGVMLFEMLTGAPPFEGRNYFELLWKHGNEPAPLLRSKLPAASEELEGVIAKALSKRPDERFETMGELADALRAAVPTATLPGPSLPPGIANSRTSLPTPSAARDASTLDEARLDEVAAEPTRTGRSSMFWLGATGLVALLTLGLGAAFFASDPPRPAATGLRTPTDEPSIDAPPAPPSPAPPTTSVPSVPPASTDEPAMVRVALASEPAASEAFVGDTRLCTTPCDVELPSGVEVAIAFRRAGYGDALERVVPRAGLRVSARLRARRRAVNEGPASGPAIKTQL